MTSDEGERSNAHEGEGVERLVVQFAGPLSWGGQYGTPCIFDHPLGTGSGVYLWTVPQDDSEPIYYVGETGRAFAVRMKEHAEERKHRILRSPSTAERAWASCCQ